MSKRIAFYFLAVILLTACSNPAPQPTLQATATITQTPSPTATNTPTPSITPTATLTPTPTPLPMAGPVTNDGMTRIGKGWINNLTFSPDGKMLAVAASIGVYLYRVETMELVSFLPSNSFVKEAVFIDNETLVTGTQIGSTTVWDIKSAPKQLETLQRDYPVVALGIGEDNSVMIVELKPKGQSANVNVIVWDRINPETVNTVSSDYVFNGEYSPIANILALDTWRQNVILVDTKKMKVKSTICRECYEFAMTRDGNILASTKGWGEKAQIDIWDTISRERLATIKTPDTITRDLVFSPNSKVLLALTSTGMDLWNVDNIELTASFEGTPLKATFSPDSSLIATASTDGALALLKADTGQKVFTVEGFNPVNKVAFYNTVMASSGGGGMFSIRDTIFLRDITTGSVIRTFSLPEENGRKPEVLNFTFAPDGKTLASTWDIHKVNKYRDPNNYVIVFFDVDTGDQLKSLQGFDPIVFSPDGSLLATAAKENQLFIWDVASGEALPLSLGLVPAEFRGPSKNSLLFSPDGSMIVALSENIILRDLSTGKRIKTLTSGLKSGSDFYGVGRLGAFSPDGTKLASTWLLPINSEFFSESKGVVILWDVASGEKITVLEGHSKPVTALAYSPDGTLLVSGAEDNSIIVWDAQNGNSLKILQGHSGAVYSLSFSSDGKLLYSNASDGTVIIWDLELLVP